LRIVLPKRREPLYGRRQFFRLVKFRGGAIDNPRDADEEPWKAFAEFLEGVCSVLPVLRDLARPSLKDECVISSARLSRADVAGLTAGRNPRSLVHPIGGKPGGPGHDADVGGGVEPIQAST
jgi:hypothetical protein